MKNDDLTQVKHIGALRMKMLNLAGITTISQLDQIPLEKLAQVKTIGPHYAKLIKAAVAESQGKEPEKSAPKEVSVKKGKTAAGGPDLNKTITMLKKSLNQANEKLKPLDKKKYLQLYVDFKKRSKRLKTRLGRLNKNPGSLSEKAIKNIVKKTDALNAILKKAGQKPKKKIYQKVIQEIQSFSKMLKKTTS